MPDAVFAPLMATLGLHFSMSKSRLMTFAVLICGVVQARTVNLSHLAGHFPGAALHASNYRRLQRVFQHERLDGDVVARLVVGVLNHTRPRYLALNRTNWKFGGRDINVLVLALVTRRFRVPLMWVQMGRAGPLQAERSPKWSLGASWPFPGARFFRSASRGAGVPQR